METVFQERYGVCLRPLFRSPLTERDGGFRSGGGRDRGHCAVFFPVFPDVGGDVRVGEEGPSQQRDGQDDESDSDCINHDWLKA